MKIKKYKNIKILNIWDFSINKNMILFIEWSIINY